MLFEGGGAYEGIPFSLSYPLNRKRQRQEMGVKEPRTVDFREGRHVSDSRERKKGVHMRHQSPDGKRVLKRLYMEEPSHFLSGRP